MTCRKPCAASLMDCSTPRAAASLVKLNCSTFWPSNSTSLSGKVCVLCSPSASSVQYSCGLKMRDLVLALADHAQRRALHASGGQAAAHLLPQQRREIEADQVIERAARLLRIHQVQRQVARLGDGALHLALGDLVEHHALDFLALEVAAFFEQLAQVPGDGFAFAVRVGRQVEVLGFLERARDGVDVFFVALDRLVVHGEVLVGIDRAFFRHQVAHVAIGSEHLEILAEVLLDGFRFGGRLDDD